MSQFLKETSFISSGGQAKWFLQEQEVLLNGQIEQRRGKKIYPQDKLTIADKSYEFD